MVLIHFPQIEGVEAYPFSASRGTHGKAMRSCISSAQCLSNNFREGNQKFVFLEAS